MAIDSDRRDEARFDLIRSRLYTCVVGDVLDQLGRVHQFLPAGIRPLEPAMRMVGRAMPVRIADVYGAPEHPFGLLTQALDALRQGDIYVARSARAECAAWGEIMTTAAVARQANGAVIDGFHRDHRRVVQQGFPVFSRGAYGQDAMARAVVLDYGVPVEIGGVVVHRGDLVLGDEDGVVVVPSELEDLVLEKALEKVATEGTVRKAIASGMSATDAFAEYGVL